MPDMDRRTFLAGSAAATAATAVAASRAGATVTRVVGPSADPNYRGKRHVAILGGGCGGLSAAHELVERGFTVDVYERYPVAGRQVPVDRRRRTRAPAGVPTCRASTGSASSPATTSHVIDTMARIAVRLEPPTGVKDNLVVRRAGALLPRRTRATSGPAVPAAVLGRTRHRPDQRHRRASSGSSPASACSEIDLLRHPAGRVRHVVRRPPRQPVRQDDLVGLRAGRPLRPALPELPGQVADPEPGRGRHAELASTRTIGLQATRILVSQHPLQRCTTRPAGC